MPDETNGEINIKSTKSGTWAVKSFEVAIDPSSSGAKIMYILSNKPNEDYLAEHDLYSVSPRLNAFLNALNNAQSIRVDVTGSPGSGRPMNVTQVYLTTELKT